MTEVYGRFPIDIYLLSDDGDVLGMFNLTLNVARAAITNRKIATLTYKQCVDATMSGIQGWIREYPMGAYDSEDIKVERFLRPQNATPLSAMWSKAILLPTM